MVGGPTRCEKNLLVEDTTIGNVAGQTWDSSADPAIWLADYKAVRVKVWRRAAAFYVGDHSNGFCQTGEKHPSTPVQGSCPVEVDDSYASLTNGPDNTATDRYHTEAIQCYGGDQVTANHDTFDTTDASHGTSSFFCPSGQGNTAAYVNGMLVMNGSNVPGTTNVDGTLSNYDCCGFAFRDGVPGTVNNLHIVDHTWSYAAVDVNCSAITSWQADIVDIDRPTGGTSSAPYEITNTVRSQRCVGVGN